jgi:hypothetical protein
MVYEILKRSAVLRTRPAKALFHVISDLPSLIHVLA